jgi:hypothetical protein
VRVSNPSRKQETHGRGRCPVGYRYRLGGVLYTVVGHREIAYGQVGCDVEGPNGIRQWVASEYIHEHGVKVG